MFSLAGKNALVTGASGGIGQSIAKTLAKQGARLVLSATKEDKLKQLADEIGNNTSIIPCNLADLKDVEALYDEAEKKLGQIDILVCNAGITKDGLFVRMKNDDFEHVLNINLKSTFVLNRSAVTKMMRRRWGRIINIASVVALSGNPGQANYVASKAGMIGMSKSIASEVASRNITVNCVAPGFIQTAMTGILNDQQRTSILSSIPMGKMGSAEDIANAVAFLASEEASYITGHTLNVNGGMLMI